MMFIQFTLIRMSAAVVDAGRVGGKGISNFTCAYGEMR